MPTSAPPTLVHTSDWHLGHELADHPREAEHRLFLAWLLDQLDEQSADVLLVTGDVYDVANPPVSAMRQLYGFLHEACRRRPALQVVILGGNHDSAGKIELPGHLLGEGQVRLVGSLPRRDGQADAETLLVPLAGADGETAAWLAAVPFCRPGDLGAETLQQLYTRVADTAFARAEGLPVILSGHLHVSGGAVSELSERRIVVGGQEAEAASLFDPRAAYVALGHLHRPQQIAAECLVRYAGSPFPLSATERPYRHSITVLEVSPEKRSEGEAQVREVLIPRPVPFLAVPETGAKPLDEVVGLIEALELDDSLAPELTPFLEVNVLVTGPEPHLQARIHAALADKPLRLTRIVRQVAGSAEGAPASLSATDLADLMPEAVFASLHAQRFGGEPPAEDLARAFAELLVEAQHMDNIAEGEA
ncbi:exonuclease SbcCD subunit D C-terminal domain-containing protein [Novosphingobium bradum]|uniref:Nuclease SbcCD subunit D n=1 Tax=Novosphingobium bradum TaxID=1737444 RepID=A0ABV7IWC8_9SPHN